MKSLTKSQSILYHLYPGVLITIGFIFLAPRVMKHGFPPQFGMLVAVVIIAVPVLVAHLYNVKKLEGQRNLTSLNGYTNRLSTPKLILYSLGLVVFAFMIWGATQPINNILTEKLFSWLPDWYTVQDFSGYDKNKIKITLIFNLTLNGLLAPYVEELYFRGYLLSRMNTWGRGAFLVNALLFSLYHFW